MQRRRLAYNEIQMAFRQLCLHACVYEPSLGLFESKLVGLAAVFWSLNVLQIYAKRIRSAYTARHYLVAVLYLYLELMRGIIACCVV